MTVEPMLVVRDVEASSLFYQRVLGLASAHGGSEYEMLTWQGRLLLQLHGQDMHHHAALWQADQSAGNGVSLWFRTDDFEKAVERVRNGGAEIVAEPHVNPNARQNEIWFRDPDGYLVIVCDAMGSAP